MDNLPDLPLLKILRYTTLTHDKYQMKLLYVCKRWTQLILTYCYVNIFESEEKRI